MKRIHIVPGLGDVANGLAVIARLFAKEQGDADVVDLYGNMREIHEKEVGEVWIHGMWQPREWIACSRVLRAGKRLVRMTHGSLSPIYLKQRGRWKKWVVGPIERFFLRRADVVVATCEAEAEWIRQYEPRVKKIEMMDVKRFFDLNHETHEIHEREEAESLHLLYLGRRHPLKGVEFLEAAVKEVEGCELRIVSNALGEEKERVWEWCDVLVLPTLSENFGLVVAEALERGKRVIITDGAPAWSPSASATEDKGDGNDYGGRLVYLKGYRNGSSEERVRLLKNAIEGLQDEFGSCLDSKSV